MDGVPTLTFRVGNERLNAVLDARVAVALSRLEVTSEGVAFYRNYDLELVRERNFALTLTWTVMHKITPSSPLYGVGPDDLAAQEYEIGVFVTGTDDTTHQPVYAAHSFDSGRIRFGARHADVLSMAPDGLMIVDVRNFDRVEADDD